MILLEWSNATFALRQLNLWRCDMCSGIQLWIKKSSCQSSCVQVFLKIITFMVTNYATEIFGSYCAVRYWCHRWRGHSAQYSENGNVTIYIQNSSTCKFTYLFVSSYFRTKPPTEVACIDSCNFLFNAGSLAAGISLGTAGCTLYVNILLRMTNIS
jgi:hypothetical protein